MDRRAKARILLAQAIRRDYAMAATPGTNPLGIGGRKNNPHLIERVITNRLGERQRVYIRRDPIVSALSSHTPGRAEIEAAKKFATTGDLPTKKATVAIVAEGLKKAASNPKAAWQAGLKREYAALTAIREKHGFHIEKADLIQGAVANMVLDIGLSVQSEMTVNTGGLVGSIVGGAMGGGVGALAGDLIGARATRKVLNDIQATKQAWSGLIDSGELEGKNPLQQVRLISKAAADRVRENTKDTARGDVIGDVAGWAGGNAGGTAIRALLPGAPPGVGAIPGIMSANYANAFDEERRGGAKPHVAAWRALTRGIEAGFEREAKLRQDVKQRWVKAMESAAVGAAYGEIHRLSSKKDSMFFCIQRNENGSKKG